MYSDEEVTTLISMMGAGRFPSFRQVVRHALNRLAVHLDIGADNDIFIDYLK
jgi:hypothetical protein